MTLPDSLLAAIIRSTADELEQRRLARRWKAALRRCAELDARIRAQMRAVRCSCEMPSSELTADGRCSRCFGRADPYPTGHTLADEDER